MPTKPPSKDEIFGAHLKARGRLIHYRVESGELDVKIVRPFPADAEALALLALEGCKSKRVGALTSVTGGRYVGPDVIYMDTMGLLRRLGRLVLDDAAQRPTSASRKKAR